MFPSHADPAPGPEPPGEAELPNPGQGRAFPGVLGGHGASPGCVRIPGLGRALQAEEGRAGRSHRPERGRRVGGPAGRRCGPEQLLLPPLLPGEALPGARAGPARGGKWREHGAGMGWSRRGQAAAAARDFLPAQGYGCTAFPGRSATSTSSLLGIPSDALTEMY